VAVGAEQSEVGRVVVAPITIDMRDFNGHLAGLRMSFCPTASSALLTETLDQISPNEPIRVCLIFAGFQLLNPDFELMLVLTGIGAILISCAFERRVAL
jgi:hypothetical protein